jgi:hypothetical protein
MSTDVPGHTMKTSCAFCCSTSLTEVPNLGTVALAGGFLKAEQFASEPSFPYKD